MNQAIKYLEFFTLTEQPFKQNSKKVQFLCESR